MLGLSDSGLRNLKLVQGWIPDSFSRFDSSLGIARLQIGVGLYDPNKTSLEARWDFVLPGGLITFDESDVGWDVEKRPGAEKAVYEFCKQKGLRIERHWTGRANLLK